MKRYFLQLFFLLISIQLFSQKKVLGLPSAFEKPVDVFAEKESIKKLINYTVDKSKKEPWIVYSDRENNPVYKKPKYESKKIIEVQFKEQFYVVDEEEDWIKIARAKGLDNLRSNSIATVGWVPKEKMLLWSYSLINSYTHIREKAILVNQLDDISKIENDSFNNKGVKFYNGTKSEITNKEVPFFPHGLYFIFKKENDRFLLGSKTYLSLFSWRKDLIGWVSTKQIQEWNTRICIEPNFEELAFEERKKTEHLQFKAFYTTDGLKKYVENDFRGPMDVAWKNDPAGLNPQSISTTDSTRLSGFTMRFPVLGQSKISVLRESKIDTIYYFETCISQSFTPKREERLYDDISDWRMDLSIPIFNKVKIPLQIIGAEHPTYSYVIYMPETALLDYHNFVTKTLEEIQFIEDYKEKRKGLFKLFVAVIESLAGDSYFSKTAIEQISLADIQNVLRGLSYEGVDLADYFDIQIAGLMNGVEISNYTVDEQILRFAKVSMELEDVIKQNVKYGFSYVTLNRDRYYWLRLDQLY